MKDQLNIFFLIILTVFIQSYENSSIKLSGKPISSDPLGSPSINNAFDGDLTTVFKSSQSSNGWIGLKLDSKYIINKIGIGFPKDSRKEDYFLGIIEGSFEPTFFEAEPLYMITEEIKLGELNFIYIESTKRYKYIRYIGPNNRYCIIAELEIYGDDELGIIKNNFKNDDDEDEYYHQVSNLPLVVIQTEDSIEPFDKENYITCNVLIIKDNKKDLKEKAKIKLRGNATFRLEKKSYRIKFDEKQNPLSMPSKAKSWTLLANHSDKTLIRNMVAFKISSLFEMKYTPSCKSVDLIVNGEFKGNYGLCDQVEREEGRIEVTEMDETCIEEPEISGGYIIQADQWAKMGGDTYYESDKGVVYAIKYPNDKDIMPEQLKYIKNAFNLAEDESYNNIVNRIDLESFCKYILIQDLTGNGEAFWSTYMTKERNDDKFYFGPAWDFDISFDNDNRIYSVLEIKDFVFRHGTSAGTMNTLAEKILFNEECLKKLKDIWRKYSEVVVSKANLLKYISDEVKEIDQSQKLNFMRWDVLNTLVLINPVARGSFEAEVDFLKEFIQKRFDITDELVKNASVEDINKEVVKKIHHRKDVNKKPNINNIFLNKKK